jgi:hypothetical protein
VHKTQPVKLFLSIELHTDSIAGLFQCELTRVFQAIHQNTPVFKLTVGHKIKEKATVNPL